MDAAQALAVVRSLANGVDPESGEVFPPESAHQRPQVVRALYLAASALEHIERVERRRAQMPQNSLCPVFVQYLLARDDPGARKSSRRRASAATCLKLTTVGSA